MLKLEIEIIIYVCPMPILCNSKIRLMDCDFKIVFYKKKNKLAFSNHNSSSVPTYYILLPIVHTIHNINYIIVNVVY